MEELAELADGPTGCDEVVMGGGLFACRLRLKCDGTRADPRFRLSAKRASPFKPAGGVISVDCW